MIKGLRIISLFAVLFFLTGPAPAAGNPLREYFTQGQQAYDAGQYAKAVTYFEKVVNIDPDFAPVYNALGLTYGQMKGEISDILWFFNVATELNPEYAEAYQNLCQFYFSAGYYDHAEESCLQVLKITPGSGKAQLSLAWVYLIGKSEPSKAIYYFQEVYKQVKNNKVLYGLGIAYSMNGDRARVLETVTQLRSVGADELAVQLENEMRSTGPVQLPQQFRPVAPVAALPRQGKSQLVGAAPVVTESSPAAPAGTTRIRLRGRLTNRGGSSQPAAPVAPSSTRSSASSAASSTAPGYTSSGRSAIDRIREIQRLRAGGGGGGTYLPSGSGY